LKNIYITEKNIKSKNSETVEKILIFSKLRKQRKKMLK
jgi:hypothetical protein